MLHICHTILRTFATMRRLPPGHAKGGPDLAAMTLRILQICHAILLTVGAMRRLATGYAKGRLVLATMAL